MKKVVVYIIVALISLTNLYSKIDSTKITFGSINNLDLALINDLNGITYLRIESNDVNMKGKRYLLFIDHYIDGKIVKSDSIGDCSGVKSEMIYGDDTLYYVTNLCDASKFPEKTDTMKIRIAGKNIDGKYNFRIRYPGLALVIPLNDTIDHSSYNFRYLQDRDNTYLKLGMKTPILGFAPPQKFMGGKKWYCILDSEPYTKWHNKFGIKNYYILSIRVE